jgi:hypothetical protein
MYYQLSTVSRQSIQRLLYLGLLADLIVWFLVLYTMDLPCPNFPLPH